MQTNLLKKFDGFTSKTKNNYQLYIMIFLPVLFVFIFCYIPIYGVQLAFKDFSISKGITGSPWVGFKYFSMFLNSYSFGQVMWNTIIISVYGLIVGFPIPVLLALMLNMTLRPKFKKTVQMVTYAPHFISTVVLVGIILQFLSYREGFINNIIEKFGVERINFVGNPQLFSSIYVWSGVWQSMGWNSILYLASLSNVDQGLHEASIIDGASRFQRLVYIDIPSIVPTIVISLILSFGGLISVGFEKAFLMQNPLNLSTSEVLSTFIYKQSLASQLPNYSLGTAMGLFNNVINFILLIIVNNIAGKISDTKLW